MRADHSGKLKLFFLIYKQHLNFCLSHTSEAKTVTMIDTLLTYGILLLAFTATGESLHRDLHKISCFIFNDNG